METNKNTCKWKLDIFHEGIYYETSCNGKFGTMPGTPVYEKYKFCPYCGEQIKEVKNGYE